MCEASEDGEGGATATAQEVHHLLQREMGQQNAKACFTYKLKTCGS